MVWTLRRTRRANPQKESPSGRGVFGAYEVPKMDELADIIRNWAQILLSKNRV